MGNDTEKLIELTLRRQDFEDIYFRKSNGYVYSSPLINPILILLMSLVAIFSFSLYQSIVYNTYIVLSVMSFLFLLSVAISYFYVVYKIWRRKVSISDYLDDISRVKKHTVLLTEKAMCLTQDANETIEKWSAITKAVLHEDYISFEGQQVFLFPKKSMTEPEFEYFKNLVKNKVVHE